MTLLDELFSEKIAQAESYLINVIASMNGCSAELNWQVLFAKGIAGSIVQYAGMNGIDLILMASHGRTGFRGWLRGSVARQVQRSTIIPVCILPYADQIVSLERISIYIKQGGNKKWFQNWIF